MAQTVVLKEDGKYVCEGETEGRDTLMDLLAEAVFGTPTTLSEAFADTLNASFERGEITTDDQALLCAEFNANGGTAALNLLQQLHPELLSDESKEDLTCL